MFSPSQRAPGVGEGQGAEAQPQAAPPPVSGTVDAAPSWAFWSPPSASTCPATQSQTLVYFLFIPPGTQVLPGFFIQLRSWLMLKFPYFYKWIAFIILKLYKVACRINVCVHTHRHTYPHIFSKTHGVVFTKQCIFTSISCSLAPGKAKQNYDEMLSHAS